MCSTRPVVGVRSGLITKKGLHYLLPRLGEFELHGAVTIEGRDDAELPEQALLAVRLRGLDFAKLAVEADFDA